MADKSATPSTPSMPLFPVSPERANRVVVESSNSSSDAKRRTRRAPPSPTLSAFSAAPRSPQKTTSDVQGIVARLESLDIKDYADLRRKDQAALKRAQMGREEAESDLRRAREENRKLKKDLDDANERDRKASKRADVQSDELTRQKHMHDTQVTAYEKEMRISRKEAFRSASVVVKVQEELKAAKTSLSKLRVDLDTEKGRARKSEQEAFAARYELVGVQEQLQAQKEQTKVIESERDALKMKLKEEEVARVAAEGLIALPPLSALNEDDEEFFSPKKAPLGRSRGQDAMVRQLQDEMLDLQEELDGVTYMKDEAERTIEHMKMECQFLACSCRLAEHKGERYTHDSSLNDEIIRIRPESRLFIEHRKLHGDVSTKKEEPAKPSPRGVVPSRPTTPAPEHAQADDEQQPELEKMDVIFSPQSGTFRKSLPAPDADDEPFSPEMEHVITERPTVYTNANGHIHEAEHQPHPEHHMPHDEDESPVDDTIVRNANPETVDEEVEMGSDDEQEEASQEPAQEDYEMVDDDDEDCFSVVQSPTAHIAAQTVTTTVPLAPLSSPMKPGTCPPTPRLVSTRTSTASNDFAYKANAQLAEEDKENAPSKSQPTTPGPADNASATTPWTPLAAQGITREEAIERLRARRERERAKSTSDNKDAAPLSVVPNGRATPLRAASSTAQGQAASVGRKGANNTAAANTPARRDMSAPEWRSARR